MTASEAPLAPAVPPTTVRSTVATPAGRGEMPTSILVTLVAAFVAVAGLIVRVI